MALPKLFTRSSKHSTFSGQGCAEEGLRSSHARLVLVPVAGRVAAGAWPSSSRP